MDRALVRFHKAILYISALVVVIMNRNPEHKLDMLMGLEFL